jgi:hypothetical protein
LTTPFLEVVVHRLLLIVLLGCPAALAAQYRLGVVAGMGQSHGDSRRTATDDAELRPDRPSLVAVTVVRAMAHWRLGAELHHVRADLAEVSSESVVSSRSALSATGVALDLGFRVAGHADAAALYASLGAGYDRWHFDLPDDQPRWRPSARGALELDFPLGSRWSGLVRSQASLGPSVFQADELPEGFDRKMELRTNVGVGVMVRI